MFFYTESDVLMLIACKKYLEDFGSVNGWFFMAYTFLFLCTMSFIKIRESQWYRARVLHLTLFVSIVCSFSTFLVLWYEPNLKKTNFTSYFWIFNLIFQKCPFSSAKKWHFERPNLRTESKNLAKQPPKWLGRHLGHAFPFSAEYQANFWKSCF